MNKSRDIRIHDKIVALDVVLVAQKAVHWMKQCWDISHFYTFMKMTIQFAFGLQ